LVFWHGGQ
jgi:hypothetical protein